MPQLCLETLARDREVFNEEAGGGGGGSESEILPLLGTTGSPQAMITCVPGRSWHSTWVSPCCLSQGRVTGRWAQSAEVGEPSWFAITPAFLSAPLTLPGSNLHEELHE